MPSTRGHETRPLVQIRADSQVPRCVPKSEPFKCKGVKRGYAFGDDDVPRDADTEYLKVKYSAKNRAPPVPSRRPK